MPSHSTTLTNTELHVYDNETMKRILITLSIFVYSRFVFAFNEAPTWAQCTHLALDGNYNPFLYNMTNYIECDTFCVTFSSTVCLCYYPVLKWHFTFPLLKMDLTCDWHCDYHYGGTASFDSSPSLCQSYIDSNYLILYNLDGLFEDPVKRKSFFQITPGTKVQVFEELHIDGLCFFAIVEGMHSCTYYLDFGDGTFLNYTTKLGENGLTYRYSLPGIYTLKAIIQFGMSTFSANTSYEIEVVGLADGTVEGCSHAVYYLDSGESFNCTGIIFEGNDLTLKVSLDNNVNQVMMNISDIITVPHYFSTSCFTSCGASDLFTKTTDEDSDETSGLFLLMHSTIPQTGFLSSIKLYSAANHPIILKVYRQSSDESVLTSVYSYPLYTSAGEVTTVEFLEDKFYLERGDYVGFIGYSINMIHTVLCQDCRINFYHENTNLEKLQTVSDQISGLSFRVKFEIEVVSRFQAELKLTRPGHYNVSFDLYYANGKHAVSLEALPLTVKSHKVILKVENYSDIVYTNAYVDLCVKLIYGGLTQVKWSSTSKNIYYKLNNDSYDLITKSLSVYPSESNLTKEINDCITVNITFTGEHLFMATVESNNILLAWQHLNVTAYQRISGLVIERLDRLAPLYQLDIFTVNGTMNPYPYPITLEWKADENLTQIDKNIVMLVPNNTKPITHASFYSNKFGSFSIHLYALYPPISEYITLNVTVIETFTIKSKKYALLNENLKFTLFSLTSFELHWTFFWYFSDGVSIDSNHQTQMLRSFTQPDKYDVFCFINTTKDIAEVRSEVFVLEEIQDVKIVLLSKSVLGSNITLKASVATGNFLSFSWISKHIPIMQMKGSEILLYGNETGLKFVTVNVSNALYFVVANRSIYVGKEISYFEFISSQYNILTGGFIRFKINTSTDDVNVSLRYTFQETGTVVNYSFDPFEKKFLTPGFHTVVVELLVLNSLQYCYEISLVHCRTTFKFGVYNVISQLLIELVKENGEKVQVKGRLYHASRKKFNLMFIAFNSTQATFNVTRDDLITQVADTVVSGNNTVTFLNQSDFQDVGVYNFTVIAFNPLSEFSQSFSVYVEDVIEDVELLSLRAAESNNTVAFNISFRRGSNLKYKWTFDDGFISTEKYFQRVFLKIGKHPFNVSIVNNISCHEEAGEILILEKVSLLNSTCGNEFAQTGELVYHHLSFQTGNGISIDIETVEKNLSMNKTFSDISGPYNESFSYIFEEDGEKIVTITMYNMVRTISMFKCIFHIQHLILSVSIRLFPQHIIYIENPLHIVLHISGGTNASASFNFHTKSNFTVSKKTFLLHHTDGGFVKKLAFNHIFEHADAYEITTELSNHISSTRIDSSSFFVIDPSLQEESVTGFSLLIESTIFGNPTNIYLQSNPSTPYVYCDLDFGDESPLYHFSSKELFLVSHRFLQVGRYLVNAICLTTTGNISVNSFAHVQLTIKINTFHYPEKCTLMGEDVQIIASVEREEMMNDANISVYFNNTKLSLNATLNSVSIIYTINQSLYQPGVSEIFILLHNFVSEERVNGAICIRRAIQAVSCQTPIAWRFGSSTPFQALVVADSKVDIVIVFGDNTSLSLTDMEREQIKFKHLFKSIGCFNFSICASNNVSVLCFNDSIEIIEKLENVTLEHINNLEWPHNTLDFYLVFQKKISPELFVTFELYYGDDAATDQGILNLKSLNDKRMLLSSHSYKTPGCFKIIVNLQTKINSLVVKSDVIITDIPAIKISLSSMLSNDSSVKKFRDDYPLLLTIENVQIGCFSFSWVVYNSSDSVIINGTSISRNVLLDNLINMPGTYFIKVFLSSLVVELYSTGFELIKALPNLSVLLLYSQHETKDFLFVVSDKPSLFTSIQVRFGDLNSRNIKPQFLKFNESEFVGKLQNQVLPTKENNLYYFKLTHQYNSTGLYNVEAFAFNDVSQVYASKKVFVTEIYCESPKVKILGSEQMKLVYHYQQQVEIPSHVAIICGPMRKVSFQWEIFRITEWEMSNQIAPGNKSPQMLGGMLKAPSLMIERRSLMAGHYFIKLTVTLTQAGLDGSDELFMSILEDEIHVVIKGGGYQQLPWQFDVILDGSASIDPNEDDQSSLLFEWYCEANMNITTDCFGNGLGFVEFFGRIWKINAKTLIEGAVYTFKLVVKNPLKNRIAETTQKVFLTDKEIPVVSISCESNCRRYVNPSSRLSLKSFCSNCYSDVLYKWSSESIDIIFNRDTLTERNSPNLVIKSGVLVGGKSYTFHLQVTKTSGVTSQVEYSIRTNSPPSNGTCFILPFNGTALITSFKVSCSNWTSDVGSLKYRILQLIENTNRKLLSYGPSSTSDVLLSSGHEENDFNVNVIVEVVDLFGAFSTFILTVKVLPVFSSSGKEDNVENMQDVLFNMTTKKGGKLEELSSLGDTQGLAQFISTVAESLNHAKNIENTQNVDNNTQMMDRRIEMRSLMVDALSSVDVQSRENIKQKTDAINPLLVEANEVSIKTQEKVLDSVSQMAEFLSQDKEVIEVKDPEKVIEVTSGLVEATGHLLNAISLHDTTPLVCNGTKNCSSNVKQQEREQKRNMSEKVLHVVDKMMPLLLIGKVADEQPTRLVSDTIALQLSKQSAQRLSGSKLETIDGGSVQLPNQLFASANESRVLDVKMSSLKQNPFSWHPSSEGIASPVSGLTFSDVNQEIFVKNLSEGNQIELFLPQKSQVGQIRINSSSLNSEIIKAFRVDMPARDSSLLVSVSVPASNISVDVYYRARKRATFDKYDKKVTLNNESTGYEIFYKLDDADVYYLGVHLHNYSSQVSPFEIVVEIFVSRCLYWNTTNKIWDSNGCMVGRNTTPEKTHCLCNHLTWFASNFVIPPNKLDIEAELLKLSDLDEYPALLSAFCAIIGLFLLTLVWARRKDVAESEKGKPTFLNSSSVGSTYHIAVYTGHRGGSGTSAIPTILLSGEKGDSLSLTLNNSERKLFDRGSVETFIFINPHGLGALKYVTVWHDDSGDDPSWFLSRLIVTNLHDNSQYHFFCNDWLSVDLGDGVLQRVLPVATEHEMETFENIFLARTARDFTDGHLWFSVISRPPRSNFTCMQRVSCVFSLLLSTMLANAMFYNVAESKRAGDEIDMGGFQISWSEVLIGFQSSLIVFPLNFLLVFLFRKARAANDNSFNIEKKSSENCSSHNENKEENIKKYSTSTFVCKSTETSNNSSLSPSENIETGLSLPGILKKELSQANVLEKKISPLNDFETEFFSPMAVDTECSPLNVVKTEFSQSDIFQTDMFPCNVLETALSLPDVELENISICIHKNSSLNNTKKEMLKNSKHEGAEIKHSIDNRAKTMIDNRAKTMNTSRREPISSYLNINGSVEENKVINVIPKDLAAKKNISFKNIQYHTKEYVSQTCSSTDVEDITMDDIPPNQCVSRYWSALDTGTAKQNNIGHLQKGAVSRYWSSIDTEKLMLNIESPQREFVSKYWSSLDIGDATPGSINHLQKEIVSKYWSSLDMEKTTPGSIDHLPRNIVNRYWNSIDTDNVTPNNIQHPPKEFVSRYWSSIDMEKASTNDFEHFQEEIFSGHGSPVNTDNSMSNDIQNPQKEIVSRYWSSTGRGNDVPDEIEFSQKALISGHRSSIDKVKVTSILNTKHPEKEFVNKYRSWKDIRNAETNDIQRPHKEIVSGQGSFIDRENVIHTSNKNEHPQEEFVSKHVSSVDHGNGIMVNISSPEYFSKHSISAETENVMIEIIENTASFKNHSSNPNKYSSKDIPDELEYWPHWVKYIAWLLCAITSLVPGFFTLLYGLSFGKNEQEQWLFSFFASVFSDVLFHQPIKVIVFAALVTLISRKIKDEYIVCEIQNFRNIDPAGEREVHIDVPPQCATNRPLPPSATNRPLPPSATNRPVPPSATNRSLPPSASYIEKSRKKRIYEAKMVDVVIEITAYLMYLLLCLLISYGHRDPDAFAMTTNIRSFFTTNSFDQIKSIPDFWRWSNQVLATNLFDEVDYNGARIQHDGFLSDGLTYLVGAVRMRQVRVQPQYCIAHGRMGIDNGRTCGRLYSLENEDSYPQYCSLWSKCRKGEQSIYWKVWNYKTAHHTGSAVIDGKLGSYNGGGYVVVLPKNKKEVLDTLKYLYNNLWLDKYSRALVIDFSTYNTNANFYTIVQLVLEMTPVGGAIPTSKVTTTRLDRYSTGFAIFLGICESCFLGLTIYYMYREAKRALFMKWDYIKDWRNWVEIFSFSCIWACFVLFIVRFALVSTIKVKYEREKNEFINFEEALLGDELYTHLLSFVTFLLYIKMLKILRFNKKISLMVRTLSHASRELLYFVVSFLVYFISFAQIAYLFFCDTLVGYSTFASTVVSLFSLLLGKFNFNEFVSTKGFLGKIFFVSFFFMMTFILLNMFISILIDSFAVVQQSLAGRANKYELIDFLVQRLSAFLPAAFTRKKVLKKQDEHGDNILQDEHGDNKLQGEHGDSKLQDEHGGNKMQDEHGDNKLQGEHGDNILQVTDTKAKTAHSNKVNIADSFSKNISKDDQCKYLCCRRDHSILFDYKENTECYITSICYDNATVIHDKHPAENYDAAILSANEMIASNNTMSVGINCSLNERDNLHKRRIENLQKDITEENNLKSRQICKPHQTVDERFPSREEIYHGLQTEGEVISEFLATLYEPVDEISEVLKAVDRLSVQTDLLSTDYDADMELFELLVEHKSQKVKKTKAHP